MNLIDIANYLELKNVGQVGDSIFCYRLPAQQTTGILLMDKSSASDLIDPYTNLRHGGFRVVVRSKSHQSGNALMQSVLSALADPQKTFPTMEIKCFLQANEPYSYPLSTGNLIEHMVIFNVIYATI